MKVPMCKHSATKQLFKVFFGKELLKKAGNTHIECDKLIIFRKTKKNPIDGISFIKISKF